MARSRKPQLLIWSEIGVLALLVGLVVVGMAARGETWQVILAGVGILLFLRIIVDLWEITLRRAETAAPLTGRQRVWNAIVFILAMTALAGVAWWCVRHPEEKTRQSAPAAPQPAEQRQEGGPRQ